MASSQELDDLRNRIEWIDEERRKAARRLVEVEQRVELSNREIQSRDQRIQELEQRLTETRAQLNQFQNLDDKLDALRGDLLTIIEQHNTRRIESEKEMDSLRQLEYENVSREIAEIRRELPGIGRLANEMDQRKAEDARLSKLITNNQNRFSGVDTRIEALQSNAAFLDESAKQNNRQIAQLQADILELRKRLEPLANRLDINASGLARLENQLPALQKEQTGLRLQIKDWLEKAKLADYDRSKRLDGWGEDLERFKQEIGQFQQERFAQQEQLKQAQAILQTFTEWKRQIEQQQREASELSRLEINRMKTRWDSFRTENDKFWRTVQVEADQHRSTLDRRERSLQEQIEALSERLASVEQEKDTLVRIQNAQADALKRFPLLWMEEVEKAIANDPNRRRQPALHRVPEE